MDCQVSGRFTVANPFGPKTAVQIAHIVIRFKGNSAHDTSLKGLTKVVQIAHNIMVYNSSLTVVRPAL